MLNKYTAYIINTKDARFSHFANLAIMLFCCFILEIPCVMYYSLYAGIRGLVFGLFLLFLIAIILYQFYVHYKYDEQEITQEASVISYRINDRIFIEPTGDESLLVLLKFNKKSILVPMTKKEYDALKLTKENNNVIVTALVKITDEHKMCPLHSMYDFITIKDIKKADINVEKSEFV